jgi:hypothetical protein
VAPAGKCTLSEISDPQLYQAVGRNDCLRIVQGKKQEDTRLKIVQESLQLSF